jgi:hypothetical protein
LFPQIWHRSGGERLACAPKGSLVDVALRFRSVVHNQSGIRPHKRIANHARVIRATRSTSCAAHEGELYAAGYASFLVKIAIAFSLSVDRIEDLRVRCACAAPHAHAAQQVRLVIAQYVRVHPQADPHKPPLEKR